MSALARLSIFILLGLTACELAAEPAYGPDGLPAEQPGKTQPALDAGLIEPVVNTPGQSGSQPDAGASNTGTPDAGTPAACSGAACVFVGTREPLSAALRTEMTGKSWKPGCPVGLDALALLRMNHWGFDGTVKQGEMVVAANVADEVLEIFRTLFNRRFPIERMLRVEAYGASDDMSMAANNTSAFNCRAKTGQTVYSRHSYGNAMDINPVQNPYIKGSTVLPPSGAPYVSRNANVQGIIVSPGPATDAFRAHGWTWGGTWDGLKDYQHFETP